MKSDMLGDNDVMLSDIKSLWDCFVWTIHLWILKVLLTGNVLHHWNSAKAGCH